MPFSLSACGIVETEHGQLEPLSVAHDEPTLGALMYCLVCRLGELKLTLARRQERARVTEATKVRLMLASRQAALAAAALEDEAGEDDRE